jgi:uronate dehydrogenase
VVTRVWMSGAAGRMGSVLRHGLRRPGRVFRLVDRIPVVDSAPGEEVVVGDLTSLDLAQATMDGVDVAVHVAGIPDEAPFDELVRQNITATQRVLEASRRAGVKRVVLASSNHVVGGHLRTEQLDIDAELRPDSLYGVSKATVEHLGRLYHDKWGLEVVCLRIGSFRERPQDMRQISTWLSHRDGVHLFDRAIDAPDVGFLVVYGVSANSRSWWRNGPAAERLGFHPADDAEDFVAEIDDVVDSLDVPSLQGGPFAHPEYVGGRG